MFSKQDQIQGYDDALLSAMNAEEQRQEDHIELIASENYTSKRVMQAQGSGLTNNTPKAIPASATTAVASTSTRSSNWPSNAPDSCSVPITPTSSHTPAARPTRRSTWRCCRQATRCWE
ncbi:hypothetical protein TOC8171_08130 [Pseudomonas syringae]